jgi:SAM-dependent methyltransferase
MPNINQTTPARIEFAVEWRSRNVHHMDRRLFDKIDFWRDIIPPGLSDKLMGATPSAHYQTFYAAGELVAPYDGKNVCGIAKKTFERLFHQRVGITPLTGRFYPRGIIAGAIGGFKEDRNPFRFLGDDNDKYIVDLNHPLAKYPLSVHAHVIEHLNEKEERSGCSHDVVNDLCGQGPGMQAALSDRLTDFFTADAFSRPDPTDDSLFYLEPRIVDHLDSTAREQVQELYSRFLQPGMRVLDFMSSVNSHMPAAAADIDVTGLGMNKEELEQNPRLNDYVVHDVNKLGTLPFDDTQFDACLCTVSVEYLVDPLTVFSELARVLKPGAPLVMTFSNRWFPPKVVKVWTQLHSFERMGLVLDYLTQTGEFYNLHTESIQGLPRPQDDKYYRSMLLSDPIFAVWAYKMQ